ncbi:Gfo/Idh/MocA family protein [Paenibacillus sinopodophylli]|uniref:Gfo/Idh/MocA family protein n=1 Tax=Paenibacillus sinopodophylli TaxID=1837342 RepID=UPI00110D1C1A|nr:Gfo/Idh/MocA family oxidoreductase [Paenibacillus sinopodophylli]
MKQVNLGIAGFGRIVELTHLPLLRKMQEYHICGVFDLIPQRRQLAERRGLTAWERLDELLDGEAEAVLIATPPHSHYAIASEVLRRGKHVLIEKPVTVNGEEAMLLRELSYKHGGIVTVFHNKRFDPGMAILEEVLQSGVLGRIQFVERRHHQFGSGASFGVQSFRPSWRDESAYGGGALLDWGVHLIDQLLHLKLGRRTSVSAMIHRLRLGKGDAEDCVMAHLELDNGILLMLGIHFGSHAADPQWIVGGEFGTLQITGQGEASLQLKNGLPNPVLSSYSGKKSYRGDMDAVRHIYGSFAAKLFGEGELAVTLEEAIEGMIVMDEIRASAAQGESGHRLTTGENSLSQGAV